MFAPNPTSATRAARIISVATLGALAILCAPPAAFAHSAMQAVDDSTHAASLDASNESAAGPASVAATSAIAAGSAAAARPRPDRQKKIYTNDDVAALALNGATSVGNAAADDSAAPGVIVPGERIPTGQPTVVVRLAPEKDPLYYAQEYAALSSQAGQIDYQVARLRSYRASNAAPNTSEPGLHMGLNIYAPTDGGITMDEQIKLLLQQRDDIVSQMSALEDRARSNGISPEVLRNAQQIAERAEEAALSSPRVRAADTRETLNRLEDDLSEVRNTESAMHQEAAAQNVTLIPQTKFGGSYTSDFLKQLNKAQNEIQQQISTVQDTARHEGVSTSTAP